MIKHFFGELFFYLLVCFGFLYLYEKADGAAYVTTLIASSFSILLWFFPRNPLMREDRYLLLIIILSAAVSVLGYWGPQMIVEMSNGDVVKGYLITVAYAVIATFTMNRVHQYERI